MKSYSNIIETHFNSEKEKLEAMMKKIRQVRVREKILADSGLESMYQKAIHKELFSDHKIK